MIKLTKIDGSHVLINIITAKHAMETSNGTIISGVEVRESLDEIQKITLSTCVSMLRAISDAC